MTSSLALLLSGCAALFPPPAPLPPAALLQTIPAGAPPTSLAMAPDGSRVYAASNGSLTVIDTAANAVVTTLKIQPNSTGVAVAPDGKRLFIASLFAADLTVVDTTANALAPSVGLFVERQRGGFGRMAVSPDGRVVYIANQVNAKLGVIRLDGSGKDILTPNVGPLDVALTPDGRTLYVSGCKPVCTPGYVQVLDTATQRFTAEFAVDGNPYRIAVAPGGRRAYTANLRGPSVSVIDLATNTVAATVPVPVQPTGLAVAHDGTALYVASQAGGALTVIDTATNTVRTSVAVPQARDVAVTPDGRRVYVSSGDTVVALDAARLGGTR